MLKGIPQCNFLKKCLSSNLIEVFKNSSWLFLEHILKFVGGYFVSIWLARSLGPELFGIYNFSIAIVTIFLAISYSGLQGIAIKALVEDRENEEENLGTIFYIKLIASLLCFLLLTVSLFVLNVDDTKLALTLLIGLKLVFSSFNVIDLYFESHVLSKFKVIGRNIAYLVRLGLIIGFIFLELNLVWLGVILIVEEIIGTFLIFYFIHKKSDISPFNFRMNYKKAKQYLVQAWPLIFSSVSALLYFKLDQIMIVNILGDTEGGYYAAAVKLTELFFFIPTLLITSLFPLLIKIRKESQTIFNFRVQQLIFILGLAAFFISILVYLFAEQFIGFTFGEEYIRVVGIIKIYIWSLLFVFIGQVLSRWLIIEELTNFSIVRHMLGLLTNVILNLKLIPIYGSEGAAIASLISLFIANVAFLVVSKRTFTFLKLLAGSIVPWNFKNPN